MELKKYMEERPELMEKLNSCKNLKEAQKILIDNVSEKDLEELMRDNEVRISLQDMVDISGGAGVGYFTTQNAIGAALYFLNESRLFKKE